MVAAALAILTEGKPLPPEAMRAAMRSIMAGQESEVEIAAFLTALRMKGVTSNELAAAAGVLREHMIRLQANGLDPVDTCGTGGDGSGTFNISTAAALVVAACGVPVVKHGNRGVSSASGSADVLTELGVKIDAAPEVAGLCLREVGFTFCFAPRFHPAMKHVAPVRQRLRFRTIFNLIGPLCNPAGARFQLIGVGRPDYLDLIAGCLSELGVENAYVVHGGDGLDEVTLNGPTAVRRVHGGEVSAEEWRPGDFGLASCPASAIRVEGPQQSAKTVQAVLTGEAGAARSFVLANAAAALLAVRRVSDLRSGVDLAAEALDSGRARQVLEQLRLLSNQR